MEVKKDILWRVYLCFIAMAVICAFIIGKAFYIQQMQGAYWRGMSDSMHTRIEEVEAERGTIYSEDGQMLSTSIPQFDIYDSIKGEPAGHFVVISGYDEDKDCVYLSDPMEPNPLGKGQVYSVSFTRLINSIMLGIVTYDANLLVIEPKKKRK